MDKEKLMSENILLRKEVITHARLADGTTKITRVLDRRINEDSDRMVQKNRDRYTDMKELWVENKL